MSSITNLPIEVVGLIFLFENRSCRDLNNLALVNKLFLQVTQSTFLNYPRLKSNSLWNLRVRIASIAKTLNKNRALPRESKQPLYARPYGFSVYIDVVKKANNDYVLSEIFYKSNGNEAFFIEEMIEEVAFWNPPKKVWSGGTNGNYNTIPGYSTYSQRSHSINLHHENKKDLEIVTLIAIHLSKNLNDPKPFPPNSNIGICILN